MPRTITANATVTIVAPKWSRAANIGHSGVGSVPNAISVANATATTQNPQACLRLGAVAGERTGVWQAGGTAGAPFVGNVPISPGTPYPP
ncbi:hypothetical protein GCM10009678_58780 [Actinomadura kijaniata]